MRSAALAAVLAALILSISSCSRQAPPQGPPGADVLAPQGPVDSGLSALVSIIPQRYFVERIAGSRIPVTALVPPGQEPHSFEPSPSTIGAAGQAQLYFTVGLPFEETLIRKLRATSPGLQVVDTRRGIKLRPIETHGDQHEHEHAGEDMDPHIWLAPRLVKIQARTIRDALVKLQPSGKADFDRNLAQFDGELDAIGRHIAKLLAPVKGREMLVFHPSFGYFADAYGLKQVCIETEGKEPGPRKLAGIIADAKATGAKAIFIEPQFASKSAETIAREIGATVITLDPLSSNWVPNIEQMPYAILRGLTGSVQ